jgi:hypothetical protein
VPALNSFYVGGPLNTIGGDIANVVTAGYIYSHYAAFQSVATGDSKWRFGTKSYGSPKKPKPRDMPVIQSLSATPANTPSASKVDVFLFKSLGGFMKQLNDCLQLGCSC